MSEPLIPIRLFLATSKRLAEPFLDEIDKTLSDHYDFSDEELDYIINYDIKYRMGSGLEDE